MLSEEVAKIKKYLASQRDPHGRKRDILNSAGKAAKSVSAAISDAREKISSELPRIGEHLLADITTGSQCRYAPRCKTRWRL